MAGSPIAFQANAFQNDAFQTGAAGPVTPTLTRDGDYFTQAEVDAQRRRNREIERQEEAHRTKVRAKARELEETIAEAYAKATGKPRLKAALADVEAPDEFTPETVAEIGREVSAKISKALEGTGKRYASMRREVEELNRALLEFERLLHEQGSRRKQAIAVMLLLAAV